LHIVVLRPGQVASRQAGHNRLHLAEQEPEINAILPLAFGGIEEPLIEVIMP